MSNKTFETALIQSFSIPSNIVHYLITQKLPKVSEKLLKTCKYFHYKYKIIVCEKLVTTEDVGLYLHSKEKGLFLPQVQNFKILIKDVLIIRTKLTTLSNICPFFIQELCLYSVTISLDEYKMLTSSKNITAASFKDSMVKELDGTIVPIEIILEKVPNAKIFKNFFRLSIDPSQIPNQYTSKTAEKLAALKRVKFARFQLSKIPENFNIEAFCTFLSKNAEDNSKIIVSFEEGMNQAVKYRFMKSIKEVPQLWENPAKRPSYFWSLN